MYTSLVADVTKLYVRQLTGRQALSQVPHLRCPCICAVVPPIPLSHYQKKVYVPQSVFVIVRRNWGFSHTFTSPQACQPSKL